MNALQDDRRTNTLTRRIAELYETLRPIRTGYAQRYRMNPDVTLVTAFVALPDKAFADGRSKVIYRKWMSSILTIRQYMIIYVEEENVEFVGEARRHVPELTKVVTVKKADLTTTSNYRNIARIIKGGYMAGARRRDRVELCEPLYNTIMFAKSEFVDRAIRMNPFDSRYFFWIDAGLGHGMHRRLRYRWLMNRPWPNPEKNRLLNGTIIALKTRAVNEQQDVAQIFHWHDAMLAGGLWGGDAMLLRRYCEEFTAQVQWSLENNLLDDDQAIMTAVYLKHPEWFTLIESRPFFDNRCYILKYLDGR